MFKLRNCKILCTKWAHFKFDACYRSQNSWDVGMFTTVYHLLFFSKQFEDVWASKLWVSGVSVLEFCPIFAWYRFPAAEEFVVVFDIFSYSVAPNVLYRQKIWTAGRPIQHPDSSTTKPCCCNSCSMWFCMSCWNTQGLPWNRRRLERSICCSKTFIYLSAFIVPSKTCKLPMLYALMHPHTLSRGLMVREGSRGLMVRETDS